MGIAFHVGVEFGNAGDTTSTSSPLTTTGGTGSALIISLRGDPSLPPFSVTDNKGNTYTLIGSKSDAAASGTVWVYGCMGGVGGSGHTVSVRWSSGGTSQNWPTCSFIEYLDSGSAAISVSDLFTGVNSGGSGTGYTVTTGTFSTGVGLCHLAVFTDTSGGNPNTYTDTTGTFTVRASQPDGSTFWVGADYSAPVTPPTALTGSLTCTFGFIDAAWVGFGLKTASGGQTIAPGAGSVAITGYAPTIAQPHAVSPGVGSLALTGYAPTIAQPHAVSPGVGSLAISGYAPTIAQTANQAVVPGVGALAITGYAPSLAQTANQGVNPGVGSLTLTGYAPTIGQTNGATVSPGVGTLSLTGYAPSIAQTANQTVNPGTGSVALTGYAPSLGQTANLALVPSVGSLVVTGYAPTVTQASGSNSVSPDAGLINITGYAPEVSQSRPVDESGGHKKKRKRATWSGIPLTQLYPDYDREQIEVIAEVAQVAAEAPTPPTKRRAVSYLKEYGIYRERYAKVLIEIEHMIRQEQEEEDEMEALVALGL